ncbi:MAG: hydrolase [Candidatus Phytoplasma solani]
MQKKLFFFDIDHTLYDNDTKTIFPQTKKLLYQLSQNPNNILGIATGRSQNGLRVLEKLKDLFQYFVVLNGAITFKGEEIIQQTPIPKDDVLQINQKAITNGIKIINTMLQPKSIPFQDDPDSKMFMDAQNMQKIVQNIEYPIYKINLFHDNPQIVVDFMKEFQQFNTYFWKSGVTSLSAKQVNKAYGIQVIQKNYPEHKLICIGDGCNDVEMFQAAHLSIVMSNTKYDYLKKIANLVAPDIQNDSLYEFFQKHNLI